MAENQIERSDLLDDFYGENDPWNYHTEPDDLKRRHELLKLIKLPNINRTLDIGCGNGFITTELPGENVLGIDLSIKAIEHARVAADKRDDVERFNFKKASIFDLQQELHGTFDLVVITGVLYEQYIGKAISVARIILDQMTSPGGYIASCHISEWNPPRLSHNLIDESVYSYRGYHHLLEVVRKSS